MDYLLQFLCLGMEILLSFSCKKRDYAFMNWLYYEPCEIKQFWSFKFAFALVYADGKDSKEQGDCPSLRLAQGNISFRLLFWSKELLSSYSYLIFVEYSDNVYANVTHASVFLWYWFYLARWFGLTEVICMFFVQFVLG